MIREYFIGQKNMDMVEIIIGDKSRYKKKQLTV
jgi:hypothetical protein